MSGYKIRQTTANITFREMTKVANQMYRKGNIYSKLYVSGYTTMTAAI